MISRRLARGFNQSPRGRTRIGRWCSGRVGGPNGRSCKVSGQESFCFSTLPHHPAGRRQTCRTRLSVDKSIEATTPHGPATWLACCVLGVARRFECSEVARTAYEACASDRRSVGAWTERAPNLRGREGVKAVVSLTVAVSTQTSKHVTATITVT